jgi:RNA polymerase sigma-70 factor (ECF subfamily)
METAHPTDKHSSVAERWLDEHGDALYAYALPRVRSPEAAEDLVQETLLAAISNHHRFDGRSSERTWLTSILKHKLVDHLRKAVRQRPLTELQSPATSDLFDARGRWKVQMSAWKGDPHVVLEDAEFRNVLARCLASLPSRVAQLFWLREAEGIGSEQLCQELEISPTNLWTMMHRARLRLRRCLSVNWFEGEAK